MDSVPGLNEVCLAFRFEPAAGNQCDEIVALVPPAAGILPRIATVAVTASTNDFGDKLALT